MPAATAVGLLMSASDRLPEDLARSIVVAVRVAACNVANTGLTLVRPEDSERNTFTRGTYIAMTMWAREPADEIFDVDLSERMDTSSPEENRQSAPRLDVLTQSLLTSDELSEPLDLVMTGPRPPSAEDVAPNAQHEEMPVLSIHTDEIDEFDTSDVASIAVDLDDEVTGVSREERDRPNVPPPSPSVRDSRDETNQPALDPPTRTGMADAEQQPLQDAPIQAATSSGKQRRKKRKKSKKRTGVRAPPESDESEQEAASGCQSRTYSFKQSRPP
jgi:hypothetical protein